MLNDNVQSFLCAVSMKKGLRFAARLHEALKEGRTDEITREMLREAIHAIRS